MTQIKRCQPEWVGYCKPSRKATKDGVSKGITQDSWIRSREKETRHVTTNRIKARFNIYRDMAVNTDGTWTSDNNWVTCAIRYDIKIEKRSSQNRVTNSKIERWASGKRGAFLILRKTTSQKETSLSIHDQKGKPFDQRIEHTSFKQRERNHFSLLILQRIVTIQVLFFTPHTARVVVSRVSIVLFRAVFPSWIYIRHTL